MRPAFMFATGIESSCPTIDGGRPRRDEMDTCGHYARWREDFDRLQERGLWFLRYGPPIHRTWLSPGRYNWSFVDTAFSDLAAQDIVPIVDPCHFGAPDWIGTQSFVATPTGIGASRTGAEMPCVPLHHWDGSLEALVVTHYGHEVPCRRIEIGQAAHPLPNAHRAGLPTPGQAGNRGHPDA